jgi:broad specificity phosphatase PhoE
VTLILVRHGQTAVNAEGRLQGRIDAPLTDLGRLQAAACATAVGGATRIVASPLLRARQTAEALGGAGAAVEVDERWIELDYGEWDGALLRSMPAEGWEAWRADPHFTPPGGESLVALARRVEEACEALVDEATHGDVVVVSHVSPIKAAVAWALGVGPETSWRMFLGVAAVSRITIGPRGPSLISYNETGHLASVVPPT